MESVEHFTQALIDEYLKGPPNEEFEDSMIKTLFRDQRYDLILSALEGGFKLTLEIKDLILQSGNLSLYQYLHTQDQLNLNYEIMRIAVTSGQLDTIQWLRMMGCPWQSQSYYTVNLDGISLDPNVWNIELVTLSASNGDLEVLKWLLENGCPINSLRGYRTACQIVAQSGNLEVIKYLRTLNSNYGSDWDFTFSIGRIAACYGHLPILQWLKEQGSSFEEDICIHALDHFECLKWLIDNGGILDEETCQFAAESGLLESLKYLREKGCPWDENVCIYAARNGHLVLLKWAIENGCPLPDSDEVFIAVFKNLKELKIL